MRIRQVSTVRSTTLITLIGTQSARDISLSDFTARPGSVTTRYSDGRTTLYAGVGDEASIQPSAIRTAAACAMRAAIDLKRDQVACTLACLPATDLTLQRACVEGLFLGAYRFDRYKSEPACAPHTCELAGSTLGRTEISTLQTVCAAVNGARDLVNDNAGVVTPAYLAAQARSLARHGGLRCTVLDEKQIAKTGLGLLTAVGAGATHAPRLIVMEYPGAGPRTPWTGIIGKGITFDSGGLNLKGNGNIEDMRTDMAGAAAVLGTMRVCAAHKPRINLLGVIPAAHNAIDANAYFPGDIYRSHSGTSVEITNTDAEGRLILADAMSYVQKHYRIETLIDLATLTGAIIGALGETIAGLFSNNDELATALFEAGERCDERVWRMPLRSEHTDAMKSDRADLRNTSKLKKGHAGSLTAAAFLQEFVKPGCAWAHLDIAGVACNDGESRGAVPKYATGFGVRLLWEYLCNRQSGSRQ